MVWLPHASSITGAINELHHAEQEEAASWIHCRELVSHESWWVAGAVWWCPLGRERPCRNTCRPVTLSHRLQKKRECRGRARTHACMRESHTFQPHALIPRPSLHQIKLETGEIGRQANGAVWATCGETVRGAGPPGIIRSWAVALTL